MTDSKGFLISFEGPDQSGKSTQLTLLAEVAEKNGLPCLGIREPGGTPVGEEIRNLLLDPEYKGMNYWTEALLYAASRAQMVADVIRPSLNSGKMVLSDRFIDSSLIYQGMARGLGVEEIYKLNMMATGNLRPDVTFVFHVSVKVSRKRLVDLCKQYGEKPDRIESEKDEFHRMVERGYRELEEMFPERIVPIYGKLQIPEIHEKIKRICNERLGLNL
ncbi:MAG: dTMP kinase [Patescibacteria group bacterium]